METVPHFSIDIWCDSHDKTLNKKGGVYGKIKDTPRSTPIFKCGQRPPVIACYTAQRNPTVSTSFILLLQGPHIKHSYRIKDQNYLRWCMQLSLPRLLYGFQGSVRSSISFGVNIAPLMRQGQLVAK
jgi:hypothetical protein